MKLYGDAISGNCYKVRLLLALLKIPYEWQPMDILNGDTQTEHFLDLNPNGKVPIVVLDDGRVLCESGAILGYFADGSPYLPTEHYAKAKVYEWLFFEQYSHEPAIAVCRFIQLYQHMPDSRLAEYRALQPKGRKALSIMEQALADAGFLVDNRFSIADIALYGYTHVAEEGGFDLSAYPAIQRWCQRIEQIPGYVSMRTA